MSTSLCAKHIPPMFAPYFVPLSGTLKHHLSKYDPAKHSAVNYAPLIGKPGRIPAECHASIRATLPRIWDLLA